MRQSSVDGFPIPKYPKKQGLCHKHNAVTALWGKEISGLWCSSDSFKQQRKELLRGWSGGCRTEGILTLGIPAAVLNSFIYILKYHRIPDHLLRSLRGFCRSLSSVQTSRHLIKTHPGLSTPAVVAPPDRGIPVKQYLNGINGTKASESSAQARCR